MKNRPFSPCGARSFFVRSGAEPAVRDDGRRCFLGYLRGKPTAAQVNARGLHNLVIASGATAERGNPMNEST